jgi:hypothetical protein
LIQGNLLVGNRGVALDGRVMHTAVTRIILNAIGASQIGMQLTGVSSIETDNGEITSDGLARDAWSPGGVAARGAGCHPNLALMVTRRENYCLGPYTHKLRLMTAIRSSPLWPTLRTSSRTSPEVRKVPLAAVSNCSKAALIQQKKANEFCISHSLRFPDPKRATA